VAPAFLYSPPKLKTARSLYGNNDEEEDDNDDDGDGDDDDDCGGGGRFKRYFTA